MFIQIVYPHVTVIWRGSCFIGNIRWASFSLDFPLPRKDGNNRALPIRHEVGLTLSPPSITKMLYANSLDPDETPSNSASHLDPSCFTHRQHFTKFWTTLKSHWKMKQTWNSADDSVVVACKSFIRLCLDRWTWSKCCRNTSKFILNQWIFLINFRRMYIFRLQHVFFLFPLPWLLIGAAAYT